MRDVYVNVDQREALGRGETQWGRCAVDLVSVLSELTHDERKELYVCQDGALTVDGGLTLGAVSPNPSDVVSAIRTCLAKRHAEKSRQAAEAARKVVEQEEQSRAWLDAVRSLPDDASARTMERLLARGQNMQCPQELADDIRDGLDMLRVMLEAERLAEKDRNATAAARLAEQVAAELAAERAWAAAHGSERLRMLYEEGFRPSTLYVQERIGLEYPGWEILSDICGGLRDYRTPSLAALKALRATREAEPDVTLHWLADCEHLHECRHNSDDDDFAPCGVLALTKHGEIIIRRLSE